MNNKCLKLPFWELGLNPIDMKPPSEVPDTAKRKKYYKENKDTLKIKALSKSAKISIKN